MWRVKGSRDSARHKRSNAFEMLHMVLRNLLCAHRYFVMSECFRMQQFLPQNIKRSKKFQNGLQISPAVGQQQTLEPS